MPLSSPLVTRKLVNPPVHAVVFAEHGSVISTMPWPTMPGAGADP